jgi:hypothetical protein
VLAGDRPILRFASDDTMHGTLQLGIIRRGRTHWLHEMADLTMEFRASHVCWTIRDAKLKGLTITLEAVPLSDEVGFATRAKVEGAKPGDILIWAYGGAVTWPGKNMHWEMDPLRETSLVSSRFDPASSEKNQIRVRAGSFTLSAARAAARQTFGQCSISRGVEVADAATIFKSTQDAAARPLVIGKIDLQASHEIAWSFLRTEKGSAPVNGSTTAPMRRFLGGLEQATQRGKRLIIETPDARLNAVAAMLPAAIDGSRDPGRHHHSAPRCPGSYHDGFFAARGGVGGLPPCKTAYPPLFRLAFAVHGPRFEASRAKGISQNRLCHFSRCRPVCELQLLIPLSALPVNDPGQTACSHADSSAGKAPSHHPGVQVLV